MMGGIELLSNNNNNIQEIIRKYMERYILFQSNKYSIVQLYILILLSYVAADMFTLSFSDKFDDVNIIIIKPLIMAILLLFIFFSIRTLPFGINRKIWHKYNGVMICGIISYSIFVLVLNLPLPENVSDISYLLSAVSQGLAAIFTLVFTITILAIQLTRKFTVLDKIVDWPTKVLMGLFAIGILLPLIQLSTDEDYLKLNYVNTINLSIAIDLGIATFCILAIIPYIAKINKIMTYEWGISKLREEVFEAIDSRNKAIAFNKINELTEIGIKAINEHELKEIYKVVDILKTIGIYISDLGWEEEKISLIAGLGKIGSKCAINGYHWNSFEKAFRGLCDIGDRIAGKKSDNLFCDAIEMNLHYLKKIILEATDTGYSKIVIVFLSQSLFEFAIKVVKGQSKYRIITSRYSLINTYKEIVLHTYKNNNRCLWKNYLTQIYYLGGFINKYNPDFVESMYEELKSSEIMDLIKNENISENSDENYSRYNSELIGFFINFEKNDLI